MSKTKALHCSQCGKKLLQIKDRADKYYGGAWWGMTKSRYATYSENGKLQYVDVQICPDWKKKKFWQFNPGKQHDYFFKETKGVKYRMNYDDVISYL